MVIFFQEGASLHAYPVTTLTGMLANVLNLMCFHAESAYCAFIPCVGGDASLLAGTGPPTASHDRHCLRNQALNQQGLMLCSHNHCLCMAYPCRSC